MERVQQDLYPEAYRQSDPAVENRIASMLILHPTGLQWEQRVNPLIGWQI